MSWINKLIYNNNEEFDIGTTFDKVYYKNEEGAITNFSLADFVKHIKDFFNEKRFMFWGNSQPEEGSNTVEWYHTEIVRNPIFIPLTISQTYNSDDSIQSGAYVLKRKDASPYFLNEHGDKVDAINFTIKNTVKRESQNFTLDNIYLDRDSDISSSLYDYYSYTLQNVITKKTYDIGIQIGTKRSDKEDRIVNQITAKLDSASEAGWEQYYPINLINFEFIIDKYYTINFKIGEEIQEDSTLYVFPGPTGEVEQGIACPEELSNYSWTTEDGSSYIFNTKITGDLTLFATSNSSSNQGTDGEQNQGTDGEQDQGTDENN